MVDEATPRLVDLLTLMQRRLCRSLDGALASLDLTVDQWRTLRLLAASPGMTMGDLAERLQTTGPTTTRLVDGLVDRALVYRRPSDSDRRRVEAAVSEAGARLLNQAESIAASHEGRLRDELGHAVFAELLDALSETFDAHV